MSIFKFSKIQFFNVISWSKFTYVALLLAINLCLFTSLNGQPGYQKSLDSLLATFPKNGPGGVVMVMENNKILCTGSYGFANIEWSIPNSPDVKFRIGSLTKSFTALGILQLAETGKLSLEDKVSKWLPESPVDENVKIINLLSHTSGVQQGKKELIYMPGERMNYSNYGYLLLGQIISKVAGVPYGQYIEENIFRPLEMINSGYDKSSEVLLQRATGYRINSNSISNAPYIDMAGPGAAGGLYSTLNDLSLFEKSLYGTKIFSPGMLEMAFTPFKLNDGRLSRYGLGWMVNNFNGWREVGHGGDIEGFNCYFAHYPDKKRTVIALQNIKLTMGSDWSDAGRLAHHVTQALWRKELTEPSVIVSEVDLPAEKLQQFTGRYEFENLPPEMIAAMGPKLEVTTDGQKLYVQDKNGTAAVIAVNDTEFVLKGIDIKIKFIVANGQKASGLVFKLMGLREFSAKRVQ
jgi:CubicO group peptidase (beta-lactamase class C family)